MTHPVPRLPTGAATHLQTFLDRMDDAQLRAFLPLYLGEDLEEEEMFGEGHPESLRDGVYDMLLMECAPPYVYEDALAKIERCVNLATADKTEPPQG